MSSVSNIDSIKNAIQKCKLDKLKSICDTLGIQPKKKKDDIVSDIEVALKEYEDYKAEKIDKYQRKEQLGEKGKEGTTFLVVDDKNREYAMKTFRTTKSSSTLKKEYTLQRIAGKAGISPRAYDYDTVSKYIVMERMDSHLYDDIIRKGLTQKFQKRIMEIFNILDDVKVFHNDCNLMNYMLKDGQVYIIDFGFAKEITDKLVKTLKTDRPNSHLMLIGLILKLKEAKVQEKSYSYLMKHVRPEDKQKYSL